MRIRKRHEEKEQKDSWLLPYSDLMTLLLALFIVLFASSSVDAQKFQAISKVFGDIFSSGTHVLEYPSPIPEAENKVNSNEDKVNDKHSFSHNEYNQFKQIKERIDSYIFSKNLEGKLQTSLSDEGLLLTINDTILFDSGSAEIREHDKQIAREISHLLVINPPHNVVITGHTDNVPIHNSNFESNWELSVTRAVNFMELLLENEKLDPRWFSAKGFGPYQPIASNESASGRQQNRRVEVLILPNNKLSQQDEETIGNKIDNEKSNNID
ncbi:flagellar motor protein MotB [Caldibacillus thermolactis]|jgi:chemotaxis protein MotB|uniref:Flagellar motor protein MotB n=1 Tax=Pallidibacillus thermolactis TaxID=251051 RepID=A0ABT2WHA6_9BACI|nr:flagellar motor protein MotB [Pallidibacillus thermolactis]MCU9595072.1 flagellar motor protein MotB [Pallidibacillus thermolactis]MCU9602362.1 flagellar motor protein MotB [Pallidibacillus thermolactis subsp. kokeshiiformis]